MIEIYTRDGCPHCTDIKMFLKNKDINYHELKIGVDVERNDVVAKFPDQKTLPIITLNGDVVGSSELKTIVENGQIKLLTGDSVE
jgi:glutaredoxin